MAVRFSGEAIPLESMADRSVPAHIVINATSVSSPDEAPELAELVGRLDVPGCELVIDLNYGRSQNFWQDKASAQHIRFIDGISVLVHQASRSFALWTGIEVNAQEFRRALDDVS